jgi:UDP-N-acetylglucosamine 2-epimerase (non-hydrolysing)
MKIGIIFGTRPEIIKLNPIIKLFDKLNIDYFILHTGQHYSYTLDSIFLDELNIPTPKYNLQIGSESHSTQTAKMMMGIEKILLYENPDCVLVQGDTNTVLAGALTAAKMDIKIGHVEAGLRSYDNSMPEEINRKITDHISDFLFAPTNVAKTYLSLEGLDTNCWVVGNTIVDSLNEYVEYSNKSDILDQINIESKQYFLVTAHRQGNVDDLNNLKSILKSLDEISNIYNVKIVFPAHPRTMLRIREFNLKKPDSILFISPPGYFDFLKLEMQARLVLTDSGGVQEECCILNVPCVTLRENTERPETLHIGSNILTGASYRRIIKGVELMLNKELAWVHPYGDGNTSKQIHQILERQLE